MTTTMAPEDNGPGPQPAGQPNIVAQMSITLDDRGQLSVTGPIDNKMLAYGMLELAKDVIYERGKESERRIKLAPAGMASLLKHQPS